MVKIQSWLEIVLRAPCPACFRCLPTPTHLIQLISLSQSTVEKDHSFESGVLGQGNNFNVIWKLTILSLSTTLFKPYNKKKKKKACIPCRVENRYCESQSQHRRVGSECNQSWRCRASHWALLHTRLHLQAQRLVCTYSKVHKPPHTTLPISTRPPPHFASSPQTLPSDC